MRVICALRGHRCVNDVLSKMEIRKDGEVVQFPIDVCTRCISERPCSKPSSGFVGSRS